MQYTYLLVYYSLKCNDNSAKQKLILLCMDSIMDQINRLTLAVHNYYVCT